MVLCVYFSNILSGWNEGCFLPLLTIFLLWSWMSKEMMKLIMNHEKLKPNVCLAQSQKKQLVLWLEFCIPYLVGHFNGITWYEKIWREVEEKSCWAACRCLALQRYVCLGCSNHISGFWEDLISLPVPEGSRRRTNILHDVLVAGQGGMAFYWRREV